MAIGGRLYTGEKAGVEIQPLDRLSRSQERMDDMFTRANEIRLQSFKENQKRFLDLANIDMESYISGANAKAQGDMVDEYNNKASAMLKARGGNFENFTTQDWVALQQGRKAIEAEQTRMTADMERYMLDKQTMTRDGGKNYDADEWAKRVQDYMQNGRYSDEPLPIAEKSFIGLLGEISSNINSEVETTLDTETVGGVTQKRTVSANMTKEQAQELIKNAILLPQNEGYRKNLFRDFESLPQTEQAKWLEDTDKSGTVEPAERENGIIRWAQQYPRYLEEMIRVKSSGYSNLGTGGGGRISIDIGGARTYYTPPTVTTGQIGNKSLSKYHPFTKFSVQNVNLQGASLLTKNGTKVIAPNETLPLLLVGYDEVEDGYVFRIQENYKSGDQLGKGDEVLVARADVPPIFWDLKININGKDVMIKDLKRTAPANTQPKLTWPQYKAQNPTATITEYNAYLNGI